MCKKYRDYPIQSQILLFHKKSPAQNFIAITFVAALLISSKSQFTLLATDDSKSVRLVVCNAVAK